MTHRLSLAVLLLAAVGFVAADDKKDVPKELKPFQGTWRSVKVEWDGEDATGYRGKATLRFEGDRLILTEEGRARDERYKEVTVRPSKTPAEIDLTPDIEENKDKNVKTAVAKLLGIYKLEKDKLTICFALHADAARPKEFKSTKEPSTSLITLERSKDKD